MTLQIEKVNDTRVEDMLRLKDQLPAIESFRLDYKCEIEYEYDFSVLFCRLHIITTHTQFIP